MLEKLLWEAFEKIGREKGNDTENGRAKYLEDTLRDDFKTSISAKSLVRYLKGGSKPKFEVRNALALYLDYTSYEAFVTAHSGQFLRPAELDTYPDNRAQTEIKQHIHPVNPYKGLASFEVGDGDYFFGRNAELETCLKKITASEGNCFISIIGDSGIGKSCFVQAGILYSLQQKKKLGFSHCRQVVIKPGKEPFSNLRYQLKLQGIVSEDLVRTKEEAVQFILFFDQFEEVITQCHTTESESERTRLFEFLNALMANKNPVSRILIITTFRSDFLSQMANFGLVEQGRTVILNNLDYRLHTGNWEASMAEIIREPALKNGVVISGELVTQLLEELKEIQGSLPILQLALSKIWNVETIKNGRIDAAEYIRISGGKGISGMLEDHAEKVVAQVTNFGRDHESLAILKSIFLNLVEVNENGRDVKKTLTKEELFNKIKFADKFAVEAVFENLVNQKSRLITISEGNDKTIRVDIVHEVLIRRWERLRSWLEEDWEFLVWKKRLDNARDSWEQSGGEQNYLLRGVSLHEAANWLERFKDRIDNEAHIFITESLQVADQLRKKQRALIAGAMAFIAIVGVLMTVLFFKANAERDKAKANFLISEAKTQVNKDPNLALRLAEAAIKIRSKDPGILEDAKTIYGETNFYKSIFHHAEAVSSATFSPDGTLVLTASYDHTARLWDLDGNPVGSPMKHSDIIYSATFSPGNKIVLTASNDSTARMWDFRGMPNGKPMRHSDRVRYAVFSPDGSKIMTADMSGVTRLWDLNGNPIGVPMRHSGRIWSATFSPDGSKVLTASDDRTARLWDLHGHPLGNPMKHTNVVRSATFSPDGSMVLTASDDRTARLWDLGGNALGIPMEHSDSVNSAIFSPDGSTVLTASWDRTARLWDLNGNPLGAPMVHSDVVWNIAFSSDGSRVITASYDWTSRIWDLKGNPIGETLRHSGLVVSGIFSTDGRLALTASEDGSARLWDLRENQIGTPMQHSNAVHSAVFSPDGSTILTASWDKTARIWDLRGNPLGAPMQHSGIVITAKFSPDGKTVLTASQDSTARLWDLKGNPIGVPMQHADGIWAATFSPDGKAVLTASRDRTARIWDLKGNAIGIPMVHSEDVWSVAFSPDGNSVLTASDDKTARLWNIEGHPITEPMEHSALVRSAIYAPNGQTLLTACMDGTVRLWDLSGKPTGVRMKHVSWVRTAAFSPDGLTILTGSSDGIARLWDLSGKPIGSAMHHAQAVRFVAFSPDGTTLLTCSGDRTARLWDLNGNHIGRALEHSATVNSAVFSPDGTKVLTSSRDMTARLWTVPVPLEDFLSSGRIKPLSDEQKSFYAIE